MKGFRVHTLFVLSVFILVLVCACTQEVTPAQIQDLDAKCATQGGVKHYIFNDDSYRNAECISGVRANFVSDEWVKQHQAN